MTKEFGPQNINGFTYIEAQKLRAALSRVNSRTEKQGESFIFEDGTTITGLKPYEVAILEKLIEKSKTGDTMSRPEVMMIYLATSGKHTVSDGLLRRIIPQLESDLEETNYAIVNTVPTNRQAAYLFQERSGKNHSTKREAYPSQTPAYYQTQQEERDKREQEELKTQEINRLRQAMPVYLANEIVSSVANDTLRMLNRNVRVLQERILKRIPSNLNLKLADILTDVPTEQVKRGFIIDLYSQLERGFNPKLDTESLSEEERELIENCARARSLGYNQNRILNATRRHFDIPVSPSV